MRRYTAGLQTPNMNKFLTRPTMSSVAKSASRPGYGTDRYSAAATGILSSSAKRPSSFFRTGSYVYSETRNLKDREVQRTMQAKIIDFLTENEFPLQNVEKMVKSPTRNEFARIFEFIYQQLDPRYVLKNKIEEEMPRVFQLLGYPVPLKPSTMQTIGAAHTMHILLGAVTWLIDVVTIAAGLEPQELLLASDDTDGQRTSLGYGYVVKCYKLMKSSGGVWDDTENFKKETENFIQIIEEKEDLNVMSSEILAKQGSIDEERLLLLKDQDELDKLHEELETAKKDLKNFAEYKEQLKEAIKSQTDKKERSIKELEALVVKHDGLKNTVTDVLTSDKLRELHSKRDEMLGLKNQIATEIESLDRDISALQIDLFKEGSQLRDAYAGMVHVFDEMRRSFDVSSDSFIVRMQEFSPNSYDFLDFSEEIEEHIQILHDFIRNKLTELENDRNTMKNELEEVRKEKESKKAHLSFLQTKLRQKEHEQALKREDWADEMGKAALKLDVAQNEVQALTASRSNVLEAYEELAKCRMEQQAQRRQIDAMMKDIVLNVTRKLTSAVKLCEHYRLLREGMRKDEVTLRSAINEYVKKQFTFPKLNESEVVSA